MLLIWIFIGLIAASLIYMFGNIRDEQRKEIEDWDNGIDPSDELTSRQKLKIYVPFAIALGALIGLMVTLFL